MIDETPLGPQLDRELAHLELTPRARDRFLTALDKGSPTARAGVDQRPPRWRAAVVAAAVAAIVCIPAIAIQQLREGGKAVPTVPGRTGPALTPPATTPASPTPPTPTTPTPTTAAPTTSPTRPTTSGPTTSGPTMSPTPTGPTIPPTAASSAAVAPSPASTSGAQPSPGPARRAG